MPPSDLLVAARVEASDHMLQTRREVFNMVSKDIRFGARGSNLLPDSMACNQYFPAFFNAASTVASASSSDNGASNRRRRTKGTDEGRRGKDEGDEGDSLN